MPDETAATQAHQAANAATPHRPYAGALEWSALAAAVVIAAACAVFYLSISVPWIQFRADLGIWAESSFLGDIIKLNTGVPLYTPPEWSNTNVYTPGAPWATWWVLKLLRADVTIPAMRWVHLAFATLAAAVTLLATGLLRRMAGDRRQGIHSALGTLLAGLLLFLAATSPEVNRHAYWLHNDALALLVSAVFWVCLVWYAVDPRWSRLVALAILPAIGFAIKQSLLAWLPVTVIVLLLLPRNQPTVRWKAVLVYGALAGGLAFLIITAGRLRWGSAFDFWVFDVMGGDRKRITLAGEFNIAILRSIDHLIRGWWELLLGIIGGWLLLRRGPNQRLVALFIGWLALVGAELLVSGHGWGTIYHLGPGVLLGISWLLAALPYYFPPDESVSATMPVLRRILNGTALVVAVFTICVALRVVPTRDRAADRWFPGTPPSPELEAHVSAIEAEFDGLAPADVLLDVGNWVYLPSGTLARDRAISLADQPPSGIYANFEPFLERIRTHQYRKILVHNLQDPEFLYDYWQWKPSSGVRRALETYYQEVRTIPGVRNVPITIVGPVSVLVPRTQP